MRYAGRWVKLMVLGGLLAVASPICLRAQTEAAGKPDAAPAGAAAGPVQTAGSAQASGPAKAGPAKAGPPPSADAAPAAATPSPGAKGAAVFPTVVNAKYASQKPGKARLHTCLDQYHANKSDGGNGGLNWVQKGGGYFSQCSKRLKGGSHAAT